mmetsp:Transcript_99432/g.237139  ORF Transcript_99432/g.237139 Transcript_99432/m.237139 type:complete len:302 (+) Transcript_99432:423-1328(+)
MHQKLPSSSCLFSLCSKSASKGSAKKASGHSFPSRTLSTGLEARAPEFVSATLLLANATWHADARSEMLMFCLSSGSKSHCATRGSAREHCRSMPRRKKAAARSLALEVRHRFCSSLNQLQMEPRTPKFPASGLGSRMQNASMGPKVKQRASSPFSPATTDAPIHSADDTLARTCLTMGSAVVRSCSGGKGRRAPAAKVEARNLASLCAAAWELSECESAVCPGEPPPDVTPDSAPGDLPASTSPGLKLWRPTRRSPSLRRSDDSGDVSSAGVSMARQGVAHLLREASGVWPPGERASDSS